MSLAGLEGTCEGGGEEVAESNEPDEDRDVEPDEDKVEGRGSSGRGPESRDCVMFEEWPLLDGRQLEQVVPVLVHEQDTFPSGIATAANSHHVFVCLSVPNSNYLAREIQVWVSTAS